MTTRNETEIQLLKILFKNNGKATKNLVSKSAYPHGIEQKFFRRLKSIFKPLTDYVNKYLDENMNALLRGDSLTINLDAIPGRTFRNMIANLENWISIYMPGTKDSKSKNVIYMSLNETADEAKEFGEKEFEKMLKKGINVELPLSSDWWNDMKNSWAEDNYTLITSNAKNFVSKINTLTEQAIVNGLSSKQLTDDIKKATEGLSDKHCRLLARDQIGKLNGQITQAQMQEIGLNMYVWDTSGDERVRPSHILMDGLLCRWDDASLCSYDNGKTWEKRPSGAVELHPGQDIQCRCIALSFYPELVSEIENVGMSEIVSDLSASKQTTELTIFDNNFVKVGWRVDESGRMQPKNCDDVDELYRMANEAHSEFSKYTKNMVLDLDGLDLNILERQSLKGKERIVEKMMIDQMMFEKAGGKGYKFYNSKTGKANGRYVLDIDGNTIIVNNTSEVQKVLEKYKDDPSVLRIKNNFAIPSKLGYSDINMNIRTSNGIICETQINTTANIVAKEYGHSLYEISRSISSNLKYSELNNIMSDAQNKLYKMSNQLSKTGDFPKVKEDIFSYRYKPYEKAIKEDLEKALPEYEKAKIDGVLDKKTIKHFEELCKKVGVKSPIIVIEE